MPHYTEGCPFCTNLAEFSPWKRLHSYVNNLWGRLRCLIRWWWLQM